jgi:hypothetical protein
MKTTFLLDCWKKAALERRIYMSLVNGFAHNFRIGGEIAVRVQSKITNQPMALSSVLRSIEVPSVHSGKKNLQKPRD